MVTSTPSAANDVTALSAMPHGTMWSNIARSVVTFEREAVHRAAPAQLHADGGDLAGRGAVRRRSTRPGSRAGDRRRAGPGRPGRRSAPAPPSARTPRCRPCRSRARPCRVGSGPGSRRADRDRGTSRRRRGRYAPARPRPKPAPRARCADRPARRGCRRPGARGAGGGAPVPCVEQRPLEVVAPRRRARGRATGRGAGRSPAGPGGGRGAQSSASQSRVSRISLMRTRKLAA